MEDDSKTSPDITDVTVKVVALLRSLGAEDRERVLLACRTLLKMTPAQPLASVESASEGNPRLSSTGPKVQAWTKQNGLTMEQIEQVFHITQDGVSVIVACAPGKGKREQTHNAYVLLGIAHLLETGEASSDDKSARNLCEQLGCMDKANHAKYMDEVGNLLVGSKDKGWKLTAPGLRHGANLVKQLATGG
jgi:hypothetical protein